MKRQPIQRWLPTAVVERGMPIPEAERGFGRKVAYDALIERMNVGDSVVCESERRAAGLAGRINKLGFHGVRRRLGDGTFRVWKMER